MEAQKINGIVVSASKYKDYDVLCNILTENGIKKVKFSGARRPNAKMAFAAQPFFCGEFLLSSSKEYAIVTQVNQTNDFYKLATNYEAFVIGSNMLKIAQKIATDETQDILSLLLICLSALEIEEIDFFTVENYYMIKVLQNLGVWNADLRCSACTKTLKSGAILDEGSGALFCKDCASINGMALSSNICEYLFEFSHKSLSELIKLQISDGVKKRANEVLAKIINNQT